jgi:transcription initiation factor IIE alpha subunit
MKIIRYIFLLGLISVTWNPGFGVPAANITGKFCKNFEGNPLPGALIVLYNAKTDSMIDYTYTRTDGHFTLPPPTPPNSKGKYYIVASKDMISIKKEFEYDPQKKSYYILVTYKHHQSYFSRAFSYLSQKFDNVINILIGLLIGLGFKWVGDRRKARKNQKKYIYTLQQSASDILDYFPRLIGLFQTENQYDITRKYEIILHELQLNIQHFEKQLDPEIFADMLRLKDKEDRKNTHEKLMEIVRKIKDFINEDMNKVIFVAPEDRQKYFQGFEDLRKESKENPLLKENPFLK